MNLNDETRWFFCPRCGTTLGPSEDLRGCPVCGYIREKLVIDQNGVVVKENHAKSDR